MASTRADAGAVLLALVVMTAQAEGEESPAVVGTSPRAGLYSHPDAEVPRRIEEPAALKEAGTWGLVVDPTGLSRIEADGHRLTIDLPGGAFDLSVEIGEMNAPRLLKEVEGDFVAEVSVLNRYRPGTETAIARRAAYNGAGLLVWIDGGTYVRFEAGVIDAFDGTTASPRLELRLRGEQVDTINTARSGVGPPLDLRLQKTSRGLKAWYRQPRSGWRAAGQILGNFPPRIKVGVAAVSSSRQPFRAELGDLKIEGTIPP